MTHAHEKTSPRRSRRLLSLVCAGLAAAALARAATAPAAPAAALETPPDPIAALSWLEGTWSGQSGSMTMEEHWTSPRGGALLGMHRDVKGSRMLSFEFLRIEVTDGVVTNWASPKSAPPTPFRLKEMGPGRRVVFENPEHDFPQRILYWMDEDDTLHARVEGPQGGPEKAMEWAWKRGAPAR